MKFTKSYWILWFGFLVSNVGDWLFRIALPLLIYSKTGSAFQMAATFGLTFLPWLLFSLIGGVVADTFNRKSVLIFGNIVSAISLFTLVVFAESNYFSLPVLYILVFIFSSVEPLIHPSFQSILPETVSAKVLVQANAQFQLIDNVVTLMGPLIGGTLATLLKPQVSILIDGITFLATAILFLFLIVEKNVTQNVPKLLNLKDTITEGIKYTISQKVILAGSIMFLFTNFGMNLFEANYVYYMTKYLGFSPLWMGTAMAIAGIGALLGSLSAAYFNNRWPAGKVISTSTILAGLATFGLVVANSPIAIGIVMAVTNYFGTINVITYFSLRQKLVPKNIMGRVVSVTRMISYAAIPLGSLFGGLLLTWHMPMLYIISLAAVIRLLAGVGAKLSVLGSQN